jgi:hypothetical protein
MFTGGYTAAALLWGVLHHGTAHQRGRVIVMAGMRDGYGWRRGVTVGQVFLTGAAEPDATMVRHEGRHVGQWVVLGGALPVLYGLAELLGDAAGDGPSGNFFEVAAGLQDGGYDPLSASRPIFATLLRFVSPSDHAATTASFAPSRPGRVSRRLPDPDASLVLTRPGCPRWRRRRLDVRGGRSWDGSWGCPGPPLRCKFDRLW